MKGGSKKRYNKKQQKEMIRLYIMEKQPTTKIAILFDCTYKTVINYLKRNNIQIRKKSEAMKLGNNKGWFKKGELKEKHWKWKGGRKINKFGYILIRNIKHPYVSSYGYIMEHRLIMEQFLGRYLLPAEVVHHKDFESSNNNIDNLYLFSTESDHQKYHILLRKLIRDEIDKGVCRKVSLFK